MIEDVINEVRELFLDEGVDEQVLLELKTVTALLFLCTVAVGGNVTSPQVCVIHCSVETGFPERQLPI